MAPLALEKPTHWQRETLKKLDELAALGPNWDSYGGKPLRPEVRDFTVELLAWPDADLPVPGVVLGSGGTVQFEWRLAGRELEIEVLAPGSIGFLTVARDGQMEEGEVSADVASAIRRLTRWLVRG